MNYLDPPTSKLIDFYLEKFDSDKRYKPADDAIKKLFKAFPKNQHLEDILLKISVVNDMYSTNIFGTFKMAEHIQNLNIDKDLEIGNAELVNRIAKNHGIVSSRNKKEINFYSFATKYCNWHNQNDFAIYDSFVEKVLLAYKKRDQFSNFKKDDLKVFKKFKSVINDFISNYKLMNYNLKEIDKFLWIYGKEKFPASYKKKNKTLNL